MTNNEQARELVESFLNGNRQAVYDELMELPQIEAVIVVALMMNEIHTHHPDAVDSFLRSVTNRGPQAPATVTILHYRVTMEDAGAAKVVRRHQPEVRTVLKHDLPGHQKLVGGTLECVDGPYEGVDIWANDEGRIFELPLNRNVPTREWVSDADHHKIASDDIPVWDIHGDFFFARHDGEGGMASLTAEDVERLKKLVP